MNGELRARASTAIRFPDAEPRPSGRMKPLALRDVNDALDGASSLPQMSRNYSS